MKLRAHIASDGTEQFVSEHLRNVAELTKEYAAKIGCPNLGYITGLLHDMGKGTLEFDTYLAAVCTGEEWNKSKLNHSAAGARYLMDLVLNDVKSLYERFTLQLICEAILCHHSGLCDNYTELGEDGYRKRIYTEKEIYYEQAAAYFQSEVSSAEEIRQFFKKAVLEVKDILQKITQTTTAKADVFYAGGLFMKALFSCLIDADRYDTAMFMERKELKKQSDNQELWEILIKRLDGAIQNFPLSTELNNARKTISDECRLAAEFDSGVYTLNCPTGSGKTYSSIRFALNHAKIRRKRQIFYIIPYMSIIDQNAEAIKDILGNDKVTEDNIAELHSNIICDNEDEDYMLLTERMDAPIILTTMVRFLNTFFSGGTQNGRPIHQFQEAVIIFDEIQSLPVRCIRLFNGLINFLSQVCRSTCILCTATQPLLDRAYDEITPIYLSTPGRLVSLEISVLTVFRRVIPQDARCEEGYSIERLAQFVLAKSRQENSCLTVMNTKSSALQLFQEIKCQLQLIEEKESFRLFFLSTKLCPAHRKSIINEIKSCLETASVIVVSTQLIEAGVDLSFGCAIRAIAGLDSWVQTAGRCNRNGKWGKKETYIVNPNFEKLSYLPDIMLGAECTHQVLNEYVKMPEAFEFDLFSEKAIQRYFELYLYRQRGKMSYSLSGKYKGKTLFELLEENRKYKISAKEELGNEFEEYILGQAFKIAGAEFEVIEQNGRSVLVPFKEGKEIIAELESAQGVWKQNKLLRKAQQYAVNLTEHEIKQLAGAIRCNQMLGVYILNDLYYDNQMGVTLEAATDSNLCSF